MVASSANPIHIVENPRGRCDLVSSPKDGKSSTLLARKLNLLEIIECEI
jgi:hypothetical protein